MRTPYTTPLRRAACALALLAACAAARADAESAYYGTLMPMAGLSGGSCPNGWLPADGRLLAIAQNSALFAILGTTYGGNGTVTFALPNLNGRVAPGVGQGLGLQELTLGQVGGSSSTTLTLQQLPPHTHTTSTAAAATHATPAPTRQLAQGQNAGLYASPGAPGGTAFEMAAVTGAAGQAAPSPVPTQAPALAIQWCIATGGNAIYPLRP